MLNTSGLPRIVWYDQDEGPQMTTAEISVHEPFDAGLPESAESDYVIVTASSHRPGPGPYVAARVPRQDVVQTRIGILKDLQLGPNVPVIFSGSVPADAAITQQISAGGQSVSPFSSRRPSERSTAWARESVSSFWPNG